MDEARAKVEKYEREYDFNKAAEVKFGQIPKLEEEIKNFEDKYDSESGESLLKEEVTENEIADIISKWTGIPVSKLVETEKAKLLNLENQLHKRVIGQDEAVTAVSNAILRSRAGLSDQKNLWVHLSSWVQQVLERLSWPKHWQETYLTARIA